MKIQRFLLGAALLGSLLSSSGFASVESYRQHYSVTRTDVPLPEKIVSPENLPRAYVGQVVRVALLVDEQGQPRDISVLDSRDHALTASIVEAVSQWRFTPAQANGRAIAKKIVLPIELRQRT